MNVMIEISAISDIDLKILNVSETFDFASHSYAIEKRLLMSKISKDSEKMHNQHNNIEI